MQVQQRKASLRKAYGNVLVELGQQDPRVVVLTADLAESTRTLPFGEAFPDRFFNMGVAEANMIGTAAGMAMQGLRPFVSSFAMFAVGKPWEQIRQVIAYQKAPVRIVATHAGLTVGEDGASHQMLEDIATMRVLPGMAVIVPADAVETEQVIRFLGTYDEGPTYVRLSRADFPVIFADTDYRFQFGRAQVLRHGTDVSLFACGLMVAEALQAADLLAAAGIAAEVLNVATIKPIDADGIAAAADRTGAAVTVEEHQVHGGLGSAVAEVLAERRPVPLERLGVQDVWGQSGSAYELIEHYGLTAAQIAAAARRVVARKEG